MNKKAVVLTKYIVDIEVNHVQGINHFHVPFQNLQNLTKLEGNGLQSKYPKKEGNN